MKKNEGLSLAGLFLVWLKKKKKKIIYNTSSLNFFRLDLGCSLIFLRGELYEERNYFIPHSLNFSSFSFHTVIIIVAGYAMLWGPLLCASPGTALSTLTVCLPFLRG